jgi:beta-lactamase class A
VKKTALLAVIAALAAARPALGADASYDVSYLWHPSRQAVEAYEKKAASLLGPDVASRLRVVQGEDNYGLIYLRQGDRDSAFTVARSHTRLLTRHGLEAATIIRSQAWAVVDGPAPKRAVVRRAPATGLEAKVERLIDGLRRRGWVRSDERTAWSVYDFTSGKKLVSINEDTPLETASLVKPFIALAFFDAVKDGKFKYGDFEREQMEAMIRESDNEAADWFLRRLGGPAAAQRRLKSGYGSLLSDLRLVEYIPRNGRTYRNKASAHDYSRFLFALWNGDLPGSAEIKRVMGLPKRERLVDGAHAVPSDTPVYDKTGTTGRLCGDMGILVAKGAGGKTYPYILVGVIQKDGRTRHYGAWMKRRGDVIRRVSSLVYEDISARHDLDGSMASAHSSADGG